MITQQEAALITIAGEAMVIQSAFKVIDEQIARSAEKGYTGMIYDFNIVRKLDKRERKVVKTYYKELGYRKVRVYARSIDIEWR